MTAICRFLWMIHPATPHHSFWSYIKSQIPNFFPKKLRGFCSKSTFLLSETHPLKKIYEFSIDEICWKIVLSSNPIERPKKVIINYIISLLFEPPLNKLTAQCPVPGIQTLAIAPVGSAMTQYRVTKGIVGGEVPLESTVVEITPWGDLTFGLWPIFG